MQHWMVFPVIIPLLTAMTCLLFGRGNQNIKRGIGLVGILATVAVSIYMVTIVASGEIVVYAIGNWPIPYGIIFVLDRLSATMVLLTNVLGLFAYWYGLRGADEDGDYFHFLFLMQLTGVNGAFLTGDMFNLFVFFEILLLTAYILVVYGGGEERAKAGVRYVVLNLTGSALFLIAVGMLYAVTGTLNMADMAVKAGQVSSSEATLLRAASYLLLVVFAVKSAIFPLYFWLPKAYTEASAPVAAIFAIMTKVGVYAILRSTTLVFGDYGGFVENLMEPYLMPLALVTLVLSVASALAARRLRSMLAYLLIASVGMILAGIALYNEAGISGSIYYMVHSTLIMGALFLIADLVVKQRGPEHIDWLNRGPRVRQPILIGMLFFVAMIAAAGLPPVSGFIGKVLVLWAGIDTPWVASLWVVVLVTSFFSLVAISRAGSVLFWKTDAPLETSVEPVGLKSAPILGLLLCIMAMTVFAGPLTEFTDATAAQLLDPWVYISAVLGGQP